MGLETVRYSEAFKQQVVEELERGHLRSQEEARSRYGIRGSSTVAKWITKYGPPHMQRRIVHVQTPDELGPIEKLKLENAQLRKALVDSNVDGALHKAYFDIVCREYGVADPEALKKSFAATLLREPAQRKA